MIHFLCVSLNSCLLFCCFLIKFRESQCVPIWSKFCQNVLEGTFSHGFPSGWEKASFRCSLFYNNWERGQCLEHIQCLSAPICLELELLMETDWTFPQALSALLICIPVFLGSTSPLSPPDCPCWLQRYLWGISLWRKACRAPVLHVCSIPIPVWTDQWANIIGNIVNSLSTHFSEKWKPSAAQ